MQTPDPLPQPGAWLVTADGSLYEIVCPERKPGEPWPLCADEAGAYYWSVDSGEIIWTPWSDVHAVAETYDLADVEASKVTDRDPGPLLAALFPERHSSLAHTTRWDVTIWHAPNEAPPAYLRDAVRAVIQAALRAAGIDDAAVLITDEAP